MDDSEFVVVGAVASSLVVVAVLVLVLVLVLVVVVVVVVEWEHYRLEWATSRDCFRWSWFAQHKYLRLIVPRFEFLHFARFHRQLP